ncbi:MarR family winged helix-turn-helix transcriptional regulator [Hoeflea ulvae]|uniref:MarR family transcriptional regulator n=1 Tax=Hoeflea ulvae TaxID=2983764 RepID=A0ABT3YM34_9HYPH|nr:MarR family transcriptional regulator [Hoeflea ulvae]MCY0096961.1 MarR family transcriptional regulator [Hoeflea ulvae]
MSVKQQKTAPPAPGIDDRITQLERKIRAASAQRTLYSGVLASKLGMHQTDLECLFIITLGENVTPGQLASETGLTTGAITGVVDRIERAGYIRRQRDPADRRRLFLEPVPERIEEIRAINRRAYKPWMEELARYSEAELEILLDFADRNYQAAVQATIALRREIS